MDIRDKPYTRRSRDARDRREIDAVGRQPLKDARVVRVEDGILAHLTDALTAPFPTPAEAASKQLTSTVRSTLVWVARHAKTLARDRRDRSDRISDAASQLAVLAKQIRDAGRARNDLCDTDGVNLALVALLADALEWPDVQIAQKIRDRFPVAGDVPDSNLFRPVEPEISPQEATERLRDLLADGENYTRNLYADLLARGLAATGKDKARLLQVETRTDEEAEKAHAGPPMSLSDVLKEYQGHLRPLRRFGVDQNTKVRVCDDARASGTNAATRLAEAIHLPSFEFPAVAAAALMRKFNRIGAPQQPVVHGTDDLSAAYRRVPVDNDALSLVAYLSTKSRNVVFRRISGHNFGLAAAVPNFSRIPHLICEAANAFLGDPVEHYVDDYLITDLESASFSAQRALATLASKVGFPNAPTKRRTLAARNVALGVLLDISEVHKPGATITFEPAPGRVDKIATVIDSAIAHGTILPAVAQSLVGKLSFLGTSIYGKVGRAAAAPLQLCGTGKHATQRAILASLRFFQRLLTSIPLQRQRLAPPPARYLVYTDASLVGFAAVLVDRLSGTISVARAWTTDLHAERFTLDRTNIAHWEALAANVALFTFAQACKNKGAVLMVDNTHVASNLISGYLHQEALAPLMHAFWLQAAKLNVSLWIEYVASKAKLADPPSRMPFPQCYKQWPDEDLISLVPRAKLVALVLPPPPSPY